MALITLDQAAQYARNAGFSGNGLATILAITLRESGQRDQNGNFTGLVDTSIPNPDSGATGLLQFNPSPAAFGPGILPIARDPQATYDFAYQVTNGGTNFAPWRCDHNDCPGLPAGTSVTPTSPSTVVGANGQPITLPPGFGAIAGYYGPGSAGALGPLGPQGGTVGGVQAAGPTGPQGPQSSGGGQGGGGGGEPNILGIPLGFLQNAGVGVLGLVLVLVGGIIIAAPTINSQVLQPAIKNGKRAAVEAVAA